MSNMRPLIVLLEQVERERDLIVSQHQRAQAQLQGAQQQASQLATYRSDYAQRYSPQLQKASTPEMLRHYQTFMGRLQLAIDQQDRTVVQSKSNVNACSAAVMQQEMRVAAVRKLIERRSQELHLRTQRQEQKQSDEFAMLSALSKQRGQHHFATTQV
jgi:flagellar FliJ protein